MVSFWYHYGSFFVFCQEKERPYRLDYGIYLATQIKLLQRTAQYHRAVRVVTLEGLELHPLGFSEGTCSLVLTGVSPVRVHPERAND